MKISIILFMLTLVITSVTAFLAREMNLQSTVHVILPSRSTTIAVQVPISSSSSSPSSLRAVFTSNDHHDKLPLVPNFCSNCGSSDMVLKIPEGDERLRACCNNCGRIEYSNPKIVVACVIKTSTSISGNNNSNSNNNNDNNNNNKNDNNNGNDDNNDNNNNVVHRTLLAKRAIEPRLGTWGIPQGYMEHGETSRQAAVREAFEETGAIIDPTKLILRAIYNVPGSVQLVYEAAHVDAESLEKQIESYKNRCNSNADEGQQQQQQQESLEILLLSDEEILTKELCFPTVQWALDHCRSQSMKGTNGRIVQQKTKLYDPENDVWTQFEDETSL